MKLLGPLRRTRNFIVDSFVKGKRRSHYCYRPGDTVVEEFAEFSKIPLDAIVNSIANFHRINAQDWHALGAKSFSERAATFYGSSYNFIFGILSANPSSQAVVEKLNRFNSAIIPAIRAHSGKRFF